MAIALIVLAAGKGTRMQSDLPKTLHEVGNRPLFAHALSAADDLEISRKILVVGHGADAMIKAASAFDETVEVVVQKEQLGTGHAVAACKDVLADFTGDVIVLFGDTPFVKSSTIQNVIQARKSHDVVVLGFEPEDPARYGRLVTVGDRLEKIVEYKDATQQERAIKLCNSGIMCAQATLMLDLIAGLDQNNASGEVYLTDIVGKATDRGLSATAVICDEAETLGVNSRHDLARAEGVFQAAKRNEALENGVTLHAPETVHFSADTIVGRDVVVEANVVFGPQTTVETGARIRAFSHIEGAHVGANAVVGPYARLRPGAELANDVKVGNFVEIKNALVGEGSKVNHLSYIGDAEIGTRTNIGAGTVTCNYDGYFKHQTKIGDDVFIGSATMLVAPVEMGNGSMAATGTVVTKDVPQGDMAISRGHQTNKSGFATKLFEKLKAAKKSQQKG